MQFVNLDKFNRRKLSAEQREYFLIIIPLANFIQQQTIGKCEVTEKKTVSGIFSSFLAGHILYRSNFGAHPVSQNLFQNLPANNLALLVSHKFWKKTVLDHNGVLYRGYKNYREFAIDWSDLLAWQSGYEDILKIDSPSKQLEAFAEREKDKLTYYQNIVTIVKDYGLWEFDYYCI